MYPQLHKTYSFLYCVQVSHSLLGLHVSMHTNYRTTAGIKVSQSYTWDTVAPQS